MTDRLRVIAYLRQSESRPGEDALSSLSLRSQEDRFRRWCVEHDALALGVVTDHDLRGADPARPGLRQLLDDAERLQATAVWVLSLSRFARDHILQELVYRDLVARGVQHLISDIESGTDDPFIRGILGLMHAKARTEQSAHLKHAFARRARDGGFPTGPTPVGFQRPHRIRVTRANGTTYDRATGEPAIEPEGATFIRDLFARFDAGASLHELATELASQGPGVRGGAWSRRTVKRMLQSPIYAGDITHHGVVVAHNDAWRIVERDVWDRVQARLSRATVIRQATDAPESWLEGLVVHACGARMYHQPYTGQSAGHGGLFGCRSVWEVTRCAFGRRMIGGALLERVVAACLLRDLGALETPERAREIAQERAGGREAVKSRSAIDRALQDASARWRRNHERFSAGKLPPDVMDVEDARLRQAETDHAAALSALPRPPDPAAIAAAHATMTTLGDLLPRMTDDERRRALDAIGIVVVSDAGISLRYHGDIAPLIPCPAVIVVPRGGKGWR